MPTAQICTSLHVAAVEAQRAAFSFYGIRRGPPIRSRPARIVDVVHHAGGKVRDQWGQVVEGAVRPQQLGPEQAENIAEIAGPQRLDGPDVCVGRRGADPGPGLVQCLDVVLGRCEHGGPRSKNQFEEESPALCCARRSDGRLHPNHQRAKGYLA